MEQNEHTKPAAPADEAPEAPVAPKAPETPQAPEAPVAPRAEPIGSLKNGSHSEGKTYYTPEEVDRLTSRDLDDPTVFRNVRNSMRLWK